MTIVDILKAWHEALEAGDVHTALDHHDAVTAHIKEHQDGAVVFKAAEMDPQPFIQWGTLKATLREQLAKSPEQLEADYAEAVLQLDDYAEKLGHAKSPREVMKIVSGAQESLQACLLNASFLDGTRSVVEDEISAETTLEPPVEPPKTQAKKKTAKKTTKKIAKKAASKPPETEKELPNS